MYRIIVNLQPSQSVDDQSAGGLARLQQHVEEAQDAVLQTRQRGLLTVLNRYRNIL